MDAATSEDLRGRLQSLLINVEDRLSTETVEIVVSLIDAGEFGIALETMAEMLNEYDRAVSADERSDFLRLAAQMGMDDRVERNISDCPRP